MRDHCEQAAGPELRPRGESETLASALQAHLLRAQVAHGVLPKVGLDVEVSVHLVFRHELDKDGGEPEAVCLMIERHRFRELKHVVCHQHGLRSENQHAAKKRHTEILVSSSYLD